MKLREEQARLQGLLKETITLLCKNGLHFKQGFIIDALIGITTDDSETFLLKLEETVGDVGGNAKPELENTCDDDGVDGKSSQSRASRKRRKEEGSDNTATKRQRAYSDDDDSDDYYQDNDYDDDINMENVKNDQDGGDFTFVKQEQSDYDGQYTQNDDQSQGYDALSDVDGQYTQDDQSHTHGAPPDGSFDGDSRDGSSSAWNQSSTNNDNNSSAVAAAGSQQVRDVAQ